MTDTTDTSAVIVAVITVCTSFVEPTDAATVSVLGTFLTCVCVMLDDAMLVWHYEHYCGQVIAGLQVLSRSWVPWLKLNRVRRAVPWSNGR